MPNHHRSRPVVSRSGAWGNILAGPPNIFTGPFWGENFKFFFNMVHSVVGYFIFLADGGVRKRRGARGGLLPPTPPSRRACIVVI